MSPSLESSLFNVLVEIHRVAGLPVIAGGSIPPSAEWSASHIYEAVANWSPGGGDITDPLELGAAVFDELTVAGVAIAPSGGAEGEVLTVQGDGSIAPSAAGGASPLVACLETDSGAATGTYLDIEAGVFGAVLYDTGGFVVGGDKSRFVAPSDGLYEMTIAWGAGFSADPGPIALKTTFKSDSGTEDYVAYTYLSATAEHTYNGVGFGREVQAQARIRLRQGEETWMELETATTNSVDIAASAQAYTIERIADYPENPA